MATHHHTLPRLDMTAREFIIESNAIEGIHREPSRGELEMFRHFMDLPAITIMDLIDFVAVYQPGASFRDQGGLDVIVGDYRPPRGGPAMRDDLIAILSRAKRYSSSAYEAHLAFETLHPFTDGNGRAGRMLWMWQMRHAPLGFLHTFYYQTLAAIAK